MTDRINDLLVVLLIVGACLVGLIAGTRLSEGEVEDAYERGFEEGKTEVYSLYKPLRQYLLHRLDVSGFFHPFPIIDSTDTMLDSTDGTWIDGKYMLAIDSTDTMSAVERPPIIIPDTGGER